jgi:hypothetical protein
MNLRHSQYGGKLENKENLPEYGRLKKYTENRLISVKIPAN